MGLETGLKLSLACFGCSGQLRLTCPHMTKMPFRSFACPDPARPAAQPPVLIVGNQNGNKHVFIRGCFDLR